MALEPPPFQEADRCDVCKCGFSAFRRRHHCRCCGRSLCHEHSSNQTTLPQFGIYTNVRVCSGCFNNARSWDVNNQTSTYPVNSITDQVSRLDIEEEVEATKNLGSQYQSNATVVECKCGMPLCICQAPATTTEIAAPQAKAASASASHSNPRPKKIDATSKIRASSSSANPVLISNNGQITSGATEKHQKHYEANGEGLREAIKNDDSAAVRKLVSQGVDANYQDRQGMSLLHMAAVFNRTDIVFILMESGANLDCRNAQGETPLDCAPATLQYKMRKKMQETGEDNPQINV